MPAQTKASYSLARLLGLLALLAGSLLLAQSADPNQTPQSAPSADTNQATPSSSNQISSGQASGRMVSWKLLAPNILDDQRRIWSFPAQLAQGRDWVPTAAFLGATAGLIALDPAEASYFRGNSFFRGFNNIFTSNATAIGTILAPVSLYAAGWVRKDSKMEQTALFAGEAVADSEIVATVIKDATRRVRPAVFPSHGNLSDSWFESQGSVVSGSGGFPSGHTIAAFSIATVVARRYGNHRWVPYAAYGLAAVVGFSRLSLSAHFLSDVFVGGALGYSISRFSVLQR